MNTKHLSVRRRRGGWLQVRTRYCAVYVRLGKGAVKGDYERETPAMPWLDMPQWAPTPPRRLLGVDQKHRP